MVSKAVKLAGPFLQGKHKLGWCGFPIQALAQPFPSLPAGYLQRKGWEWQGMHSWKLLAFTFFNCFYFRFNFQLPGSNDAGAKPAPSHNPSPQPQVLFIIYLKSLHQLPSVSCDGKWCLYLRFLGAFPTNGSLGWTNNVAHFWIHGATQHRDASKELDPLFQEQN